MHQLLSSLTQTAHYGPAPNTRESPVCTWRALPDAPVTVFTDTDSTLWTSTQHQGKPSLHLESFARCTSYCLHRHRQHIMDQHATPGKAQSAPGELCQLHQLLSPLTQTAHHGPTPSTRERPVCTCSTLPAAPVTSLIDTDRQHTASGPTPNTRGTPAHTHLDPGDISNALAVVQGHSRASVVDVLQAEPQDFPRLGQLLACNLPGTLGHEAGAAGFHVNSAYSNISQGCLGFLQSHLRIWRKVSDKERDKKCVCVACVCAYVHACVHACVCVLLF